MPLHLIHPALVHFSVAFIVVGGLAEIAAWATDREGLGRWAGGLVLIGLATLVPTIASGYLAANTVDPTPAAMEVLADHERNAWLLLGLLFAGQFLKGWFHGDLSGWRGAAYGALMLAAVALTAYSAWLGGKMVYVHGTGVL